MFLFCFVLFCAQAFQALGYHVNGVSEDDPLAKKFLLMSAYGDFDQQYGTKFFNRHFGYPEETTLMELIELMDKEIKESGLNLKIPSNVINLQRCLMTLNGVASETGAGQVRPSAMWRRKAEQVLREEGEA